MRSSTITSYLIVAAAVVVVAAAAVDALRSKSSSTPTLASATTIDSLESGSTTATREERVEQIGKRWAADFASSRSCALMTQPLCERIACRRVGGDKIRNCRPPTSAFRKSFDGAVVREITFKDQRAAAEFSNGEVVELEISGAEGNFLVTKIGVNAGSGFFE